MAILLVPVSATVPIANSTGPNYAAWTWVSYPNITRASIDGTNISNFDVNSTAYIINGAIPGSVHIFNLYTTADTGTSSARIPVPAVSLLGFITLLIIAAAFFVYGVIDHTNRIFGNVICMFIAAFILWYLGTVIGEGIVGDATIIFTSLSTRYLLWFIGTAAFVYALIMSVEVWFEHKKSEAAALLNQEDE